MFIGFNVTFFTQFMLGSHGMPRRYYNYQPEFQIYHVISTIGSYIMAAGFFWTLYYLVQSLFSGAKAPSNPWGWSKPRVAVHLAAAARQLQDHPLRRQTATTSASSKWDEEEGGYVVDRSRGRRERPDH